MQLATMALDPRAERGLVELLEVFGGGGHVPCDGDTPGSSSHVGPTAATPEAQGQQFCGACTRTVDPGSFKSFAGGRTGRRSNPPPQFGHTPPSRCSTQSAQNVHS